jgi:hypothetical protein
MATADMLTLKDLAARWQMPEKSVKAVVIARGVPYLSLTPANMRVVWARVRFSLDRLEAWEARQQRAFEPREEREERRERERRPVRRATSNQLGNWRGDDEPPPDEPAPEKRPARRAAGPSQLGNWRDE